MGELRVSIDRIAAGGAGVGRLPDGRAVFVHRTAPGETVAVQVTQEKRRWARARLVRIIDRAGARRRAPCRYYDRCGGCTLEHIEYGAQLRAKSELVAESLRRIGGIDAAPPYVVPSPTEFRYRNRISVTLGRRGSGRVRAGFHELEMPGRILDITGECLLPEPALADVWDRLRAAWGSDAHRLPSGDRLRLTLRVTDSGAASLVIDGGYSAGRPDELLELVPGLASVWHRPEGGDVARLLAGDPALSERWGDAELELAGDVFLQVNRGAAAFLEAHVTALALESEPRSVVDAYCGVGLHAQRLAAAGVRITGIESDVRAVEYARRSAAARVEFVHGRVEDHLADSLPADLVILNPPRAGLHPAVPDVLVSTPPRLVIYVSCDPATLARDLGRLGAAFTLRSVRCFDLFPQTSHVETVAELACATT